MSGIRFTINRQSVGGVTSVAYVPTAELRDGNGLAHLDDLKEDIWQAISLDLLVTIAEHTAPACFWEDPDHWAEDWAEQLGCDRGEVPERVGALLDSAMERDS
jgi:hypothetical protein